MRRTRAEIDADVFDAVRVIAAEKGMSQITFTDIAQKADIKMSVLLNNFKSVESILDKYAYMSDYWLHDLFNNYHPTDQASEELLRSTLRALAEYMYDNLDMQNLLIWELEADNATTRNIARSREKYYQKAIDEYKRLFEGSGISIDIIAGMFTAGIYYLILHRNRSNFWGVNYQRKENRKRLYETIEYLSQLVFADLEKHNRTVEIARNFKQKGISNDVIAECTGLAPEVVEGL